MEKYRWSEEIFDDLRSNIIAALDLSREQNDEEVCRFIEKEVEEYSRKNLLTLKEREQLEHLLFNSLRKYDAIQELLEDPEVTEIMINGASRIFYEKKGKLFRAQTHFSSEQKLGDVIQQMAGNSNRMVNEASPIVDTRLADGSRVNIVLSPISIDGAAVSIRKFPQTPILMEDLIRIESITEEAAAFLKVLVMAGYNIFISGGTGSGKTTFLNALSQYIPREERIITIEDSAELRLVDKPNLVRLETRNQMFEGVKPITIRDLIRTALRMRPERIVVGECRGEEALDMLQARQAFYPAHLTDSDISVSGVIIALEGSVEALDVLFEDFGRARTVIVKEVYKPGCHADEHPDVAFLDFPARRSCHLQPHFLIGLVTADIVVFHYCLTQCFV